MGISHTLDAQHALAVSSMRDRGGGHSETLDIHCHGIVRAMTAIISLATTVCGSLACGRTTITNPTIREHTDERLRAPHRARWRHSPPRTSLRHVSPAGPPCE
jgi:hypothetical protein